MYWRGFGRKRSGPHEHELIFGELPVGGSTELRCFDDFFLVARLFLSVTLSVCCVTGDFEVIYETRS